MARGGDDDTARRFDQALAPRDGPILPLIPGQADVARMFGERYLGVDATAAAGNAALLAGAA